MDFKEIVYRRRTIRRFKQDPISLDILKELIDFARLAPAGMNIQCLDYVIVVDENLRRELFSMVNFASSLPKEQRVPEEGRRPTAYIIILHDTNIKKTLVNFDVGASVENLLLGAVYHGVACCWMANIDRNKIRELLKIPDSYEIMQVISMGYPDEESVIEPYITSFTYWKDDNGIMHVPKKSVEQSIYKVF